MPIGEKSKDEAILINPFAGGKSDKHRDGDRPRNYLSAVRLRQLRKFRFCPDWLTISKAFKVGSPRFEVIGSLEEKA